MPNCKFDNGLDGWHPFTEDGTANFSVLQGGGECHAPSCPAAYIVTDSYFVGGIYQQVPVIAGNTYYANINWLVFDSLVNDASVNNAVGGGIGRRIGIDPFGGASSTSSNVIWSTDNWRSDCKTCAIEYVTATAQADTITVFVRIDDTWRQRAAEKGFSVPSSKDQFWLDEVGLKQVAGDAAPLVNPTDTPPPATNTPEPESPTDTPAPATDTPIPATETPVGAATEPQAEPVSPVSTPTPEATIAPPPTLTPSMTPSPTNTAAPRPSPAPTRYERPTTAPAASAALPVEWLGVAGTTICGGGVVLVIMVVVIVGLVWLYRLGWGTIDDEDYDTADDNDDEDVVVEIIED